jgi:hypothetical protein
MLIPQTAVEDEQIGPYADRLRDQAVVTGREAVERGKTVARRAAEDAKETAVSAGRDQAQGLQRSTAKRAGTFTDN